MNKNANIEKINKIGKLGRTFSKMLMILCIVGTIITAVTIGIDYFNPGKVTLFSDAGQADLTELLIDCAVMVLSAVFYYFSGRFSKVIESCETPFTESVIKEMKVFAVVYIVFNCMFGLTETAFGILPSILTILLLVNVFAYGTELQKESDELL